MKSCFLLLWECNQLVLWTDWNRIELYPSHQFVWHRMNSQFIGRNDSNWHESVVTLTGCLTAPVPDPVPDPDLVPDLVPASAAKKQWSPGVIHLGDIRFAIQVARQCFMIFPTEIGSETAEIAFNWSVVWEEPRNRFRPGGRSEHSKWTKADWDDWFSHRNWLFEMLRVDQRLLAPIHFPFSTRESSENQPSARNIKLIIRNGLSEQKTVVGIARAQLPFLPLLFLLLLFSSIRFGFLTTKKSHTSLPCYFYYDIIPPDSIGDVTWLVFDKRYQRRSVKWKDRKRKMKYKKKNRADPIYLSVSLSLCLSVSLSLCLSVSLSLCLSVSLGIAPSRCAFPTFASANSFAIRPERKRGGGREWKK